MNFRVPCARCGKRCGDHRSFSNQCPAPRKLGVYLTTRFKAATGSGGGQQDGYRLERNLEEAAVRYAHERGYLSRKMNGLGFRSWPDRLFLWPKGNRQEYVEFKLPGEEPEPLQAKLHRTLRAKGCVVHVCDNLEHLRAILAN